MTISHALFSSTRDDWPTPGWLFSELDREFGFTLDAAASLENAKCPTYFTRAQDGLAQPWAPHVVFCNPPYGTRETGRWVAKAFEESERGTTAVLLLPARTDTRWWHDYIEPRVQVRFLRGRLKFEGAEHPAPFPSAVVVFRPPSDPRRRRTRSQ